MANNDLWREHFGENLVRASFLPTTTQEPTRDDFYDSRFGKIDRPGNGFAEMLKNPDPEFLKMAAERDPKLRRELDDAEAAEVAKEFLAKNPRYYASNPNFDAIVSFLGEQYLGNSNEDAADTELALYRAGHWTVENLTSAYQSLLKLGHLEVPKGAVRELTSKEKTAVLSAVRAGDIEGAVIDYVTYAYGGKLPKYSSQREFLAQNSELVGKASVFVFSHTRTDVAPSRWAEFRHRIARIPMLTLPVLESAWDRFCEERAARPASVVTPTEEENKQDESFDFDNLPIEELGRLRALTLREQSRRK
ncbi:MAG: hypothetical protein JSS87_15175 [Acidobacteria bacterium]|nr:hypothetical protein [Acidobacteriota bacterium]